MTSRYLEIRGLRVHFRDCPGGEPALVLLPGLSATASMFAEVPCIKRSAASTSPCSSMVAARSAVP
jgi:hypothetical protein